MDSGFTYRSPNTSRRFLVTSLNLTVATFLLAFGEAAVTATIKDPTTNFRARPFTVARIQLAVERAGETFPGPMLYGQKLAIPTFCGAVSGTLMFWSTHASALLRSIAFT
jgi:hypothetical protein